MVQLAAGEELVLDGVSGKVRMGLGWHEERNAGVAGSGRLEIDLDATALQFRGSELFDLAFYNNLKTRDGSVVHLGDHKTGGAEGDDESIVVDLDHVHAPVDTVLFLVSSYQGHSLEWVAGAYCRLVDADEQELARFTLTLSIKETGAVMALLRRTGEGWTLKAVGEGVAITKPTEGLAKLTRFVS
ncbi:TerD family protein [Nocardioides sp.]|uniref:TerD family protein n=1 Tax=Nocardioides sp. TaxID=35761 RepID=UPI0035655AB8